ncbi:7636_t:CDS:2 [Diversispora eburnea]|uniref:Mediator of RNA polymerase II transcription subunit 7 n=1 Tax=Diversispora eburnea TaxID=1213867 RepID=A0A9N8ZBJ2_9GLOM|nr:7636_t:CDS:2 [Diversispora eburnea]
MTTQNIGSSYPPPPEIYKRYTDENLAKFKQVKEKGIEAIIHENVALPTDFNILDLEPPPPLTEGVYSFFGEFWQVVDRNATLEENGVPQLFPPGKINRAVYLKKLNNSAVFNFVELLDTLVKDPDQAPEKIEQIKHIILNMKYLLNEYRPHQIEQRKKATNEINKRCSEFKSILQNVKNAWKNMDYVKMDIDTDEKSIHPKTDQEKSISSYYINPDTTQKMLNMIDEIE